MKKIVSGITATGKLTLGNYLGAIKNFVQLQKEYQMFIFVADLHALTIDIDPKTLNQNKKDIMALYVASGLDPNKVTLFYQSDVLAHGYTNWIMENLTTIGELERMTQYKDKSAKFRQSNGTVKIKTGLLTYPSLMAGDILLYNPELVPVGIDQKQHLELTRNIAQRFNNKYGNTFTLPKPYIPKLGAKIMSLTDPTKKMSKSDSNVKSTIYLLDNPEIAYQKIQKAVTDSENKIYYDFENKPGVSNLLTIFASLKNYQITEAEKHFANKNYGQFKQEIGQIVKEFLNDLQKNYQKALKQIEQIATQGAQKADQVASQTLKIIKEKIGL